ncbi:hypothetical protein F5Y15DRAFT_420041 [Xylariaceae sp. FL0016]|nr:hypothetical protein F5Y15DRAFT_420041 [Xylariaceae sp. FL0016]
MRFAKALLILPVMAMANPIQRADTKPRAEPRDIFVRSTLGDAAAWVTGIGIWATLGYSMYHNGDGRRYVRWVLRLPAERAGDVTDAQLEEGRALVSSGMQSVELDTFGSDAEDSDDSDGEDPGDDDYQEDADAEEAEIRAQQGLIELPEPTEDEKDLLIGEFELAPGA